MLSISLQPESGLPRFPTISLPSDPLQFADEIAGKGGKDARNELNLLTALLIIPGKSQVSTAKGSSLC